MLKFSYNFSPTLKKTIETAELLRRDILLFPLSPKDKLHHRWEAMINRLYWSFALNESTLNKKDIIRIVTNQDKKGISDEEKDILNYQKALAYIDQNWLVSKRPVTASTIQLLHSIAYPKKSHASKGNIKQMLDYLQTTQEHPLIQAAIAYIQCLSAAPFSYGNGPISRLVSLLFLYKQGYNIRGLFVIEEYWKRNLETFTSHKDDALKNENLTLWIEYFVQACIYQLTKIKNDITAKHFTVELSPSFWELNDRQKEILSFLDQPGTTITNSKVQKLFKISQITASRDLTKLAVVNLLFPHGHGRSVYYTKV